MKKCERHFEESLEVEGKQSKTNGKHEKTVQTKVIRNNKRQKK